MTLRPWAKRLLALGFSCLVFVGALEAILRLAPGLIGPPLANWVYAGYGTFPGGIYFAEPEARMNFQRPSFTAHGYFNGYHWTHVTDQRGFRNPPGVETGWLLLGDSMIYGHGVQEEDTVAAVLRRDHHRPAYSMGRQADCFYQDYVLLRLFLEELSPERVVLFVFANDFDDLLVYRSPEELRALPERDAYDYDRIRARLADPDWQRDVPLSQFPYALLSMRLLRGLVHELAVLPWVPVAYAAEEGEAAGEMQPYVRTMLDDDAFALVAGYYRALLPDLAERTRAVGAELSVVQLDVGPLLGPGGVEAQDRVAALLREIGAGSGVAVTDTRALFADCADCFLVGDGHLSPAGHRRLAGFLDEWLTGATSSPSPPSAPSP